MIVTWEGHGASRDIRDLDDLMGVNRSNRISSNVNSNAVQNRLSNNRHSSEVGGVGF